MEHYDGKAIKRYSRLCPLAVEDVRHEAIAYHHQRHLLSDRRKFVECGNLPINVLEETRRGYFGICPKGIERFVTKKNARDGTVSTMDRWVRLTQLHLHDEVSGRTGRKSVTYRVKDGKLVEVP